jgi:glycosyltransferase involved in cell wall biosynthesis
VIQDIEVYGITEEFYKHHRSFEHNYSKLMTKHGHKPTVIYLSREKNIRVQKHEFGHKIVAVPINGPRYIRQINSAVLASTLQEMKEADVIHIFCYYSNFYDALAPILRFKGLKFVAQGQAIAPSTFSLDLRKTLTLQFAEHVIPINSDDVKRITTDYKISSSKVTLIPNGVDTTIFKPMTKSRAKNVLGISEDNYRILAIARLEHGKGIDILLHAFAQVLKSKKNVDLIIVGNGPMRMTLESLADKLGLQKHVLFAGFVPNELTPYYYNSADIFVIPSRDEACSIALLEAMACGLPVIGSRTGGIKDVIQHMVNGILFEVEDYQSLAFTLLKVISNEDWRIELGKNARKIAEEKYDVEKIYMKLIKVFEEVLEHPK